MKDKVERGRLVVPLGSSNGQAKLTEAKVLEMRSLYASGEYTYRDLADLYGVSISTAYPAITGKTWRHV